MRLRLWFAVFDTLSWISKYIPGLDRAQYYALVRAGAVLDGRRR